MTNAKKAKYLEATAAAAVEYERKVIGCVAMDFDEVSECRAVGLSREMFRDPIRRAIWAVAEDADDAGESLEVVELQRRASVIVRGESAIEDVRAEIAASVADMVDSKWARNSAVEIVKIQERRELFAGLEDAQIAAVSGGTELAAQVIEAVLDGAAESREKRGTSNRRTFAKIIQGLIDGANRPNLFRKIRTGASGIDDIAGGFDKSSLNILAARPSVGKSTFAAHVARMFSANGRRVGIISLEMDDDSLGLVFLSAESGIPSGRIERGTVTNDGDLSALIEAGERLYERGIVIEAPNGGSLYEVRSAIKRLVRREKVELVIVDYLQLIEGPGSSLNEKVSAVSRALKMSARTLGVPIVALSQFSRAVEKEGGREPMLSDLRDSGAIEQDADFVAFLHRSNPEDRETVRFIVAKNRTGPVGKADYRVEYANRRFIEPVFPAKETPKPVTKTVEKKTRPINPAAGPGSGATAERSFFEKEEGAR